jgi:hypothetical protein
MFKSKRVIVDVLLFLFLVFVPFIPWYLVALCIGLSAWYFDNYFEALFFGFVMDILFSSSLFFHIFDRQFALPFTFISFMLVIILQSIKNKVRFYS